MAKLPLVPGLKNKEEIDYFIKKYLEEYAKFSKKESDIFLETHFKEEPQILTLQVATWLLPSFKLAIESFGKIIKYSYVKDDEPRFEVLKTKNGTIKYLIEGYFEFKINNSFCIIKLYDYGNGITQITIYYNDNEIEDKFSNISNMLNDFNPFKNEIVKFNGNNFEPIEIQKSNIEDIYLDESKLNSIKHNLIDYINNYDEMIKNGLKSHRGVLFSGPPGTGKTMMCRAISSILEGKVTIIWSTSASINKASNITVLFDTARHVAPCLIIMEDIDGIGTSREAENQATNPYLSELLTQLDGATNNDGIFIIATTNYPEMVDKALKNRSSRFDRHYKFINPPMINIDEFFVKKLGLTSIKTKKLENKSYADLEEIVNTTKHIAINRNVTVKDLDDAIEDFTTSESVSQDVMVA